LPEKLKQYEVNQFRSVPVVVKEDATVYEAISTMYVANVGTSFVLNKDNWVSGVLSSRALLRASMGNQELNSIHVHIIMTRIPNITVCYSTYALIEAAKKLIDKQIDALPVVKEMKDGLQVIGRITKTNITKVFVELILE